MPYCPTSCTAHTTYSISAVTCLSACVDFCPRRKASLASVWIWGSLERELESLNISLSVLYYCWWTSKASPPWPLKTTQQPESFCPLAFYTHKKTKTSQGWLLMFYWNFPNFSPSSLCCHPIYLYRFACVWCTCVLWNIVQNYFCLGAPL